MRALEAPGRSWLAAELDPALLLRLLAAGMDQRALVRRLFGEALVGDRFPEAEWILWHVERAATDELQGVTLVIHSSIPWLEPLAEADVWTAKGWPDSPEVAEESDPE